MEQKSDPADHLRRTLSLDIARVTEAAAVAAARLRGRGDEKQADRAAAEAMRRELAGLPISGRIVIGPGEAGDVPVLYIGEEMGLGGTLADIAAGPLEGTTLCAKSLPGALAVLAVASQGGLLRAPDIYMEKIAIGPGYESGIVSLDFPVAENLHRLAEAKGVKHPIRMTVAASNGERVWAFRYSSDGRPASLFHSVDGATRRLQFPQNRILHDLSDDSRLILSEPFGGLEGAWKEVPQAAYAIVGGGEDRIGPFSPRP